MSAESLDLDQLDALARAVIDADAAVDRYAETPHARFRDDTASGLFLVAHNARQKLIAETPAPVIAALLVRVRDTATLQREAWLDCARGTCPSFLKLGKCDTCESQALAKYPAAPPSPESGG